MESTRTNGNSVFIGMFTEMEKASFQGNCHQEILENISDGLAGKKNVSGILEGLGWKAFKGSQSSEELTDCIKRIFQGTYDTKLESTSNKENLE